VLYGYSFLPNGDERECLDKLTLGDLLTLAKQKKINLDGIDSRNKRRVIRAIEAKGQKPTKKGLRQGTMVVGLKLDSDELRKKIEQRTDKMLESGLEDEVKVLAEKYGWDIEPMKGIGYREWKEYFEGNQTLEQTRQRIIASTMGLAKRQRTWFKRHKNIRWFGSTDKAYRYISSVLNN
jgi:tRNA dimethylallyltransferase